MESLNVHNAEYLPVNIEDHSGKVVAENYAFLNLLGAEDAIDMEKSEYRMSALDKQQIASIDNIVLDKKAIPPDIKIFRCSKELRLILINEEVYEALKCAGLTGFRVFEAEGWDGFDF